MTARETNENPEVPGDQASESNSRRRGLAALLALLVFIIAACCWIASTQMAEVPDVIGMTETEAREALDTAGFEIDVDGSAEGVAVSQIPEGGRRALKGTRVIVTFDGVGASEDDGSSSTDTGASDSLGTDGHVPSDSGDGTDGYIPGGLATSADNRPIIPMVGNTPESSAVSTLRNAGYRVVIGGYGPTTTVATGNVYFQEPAFGSRAAYGSTVTLWISSGAPHENGYQGVPYPSPTN